MSFILCSLECHTQEIYLTLSKLNTISSSDPSCIMTACRHQPIASTTPESLYCQLASLASHNHHLSPAPVQSTLCLLNLYLNVLQIYRHYQNQIKIKKIDWFSTIFFLFIQKFKLQFQFLIILTDNKSFHLCACVL